MVNTDTRHVAPEQSFATVSDAVRGLQRLAYTVYFKKTDSVLRGNVGSELSAFAHRMNQPIYFLPAYPQLGRTTVEGTQYVNGVPLAETVFAQDPQNPVRSSKVSQILREQCTLPVVEVAVSEFDEKLGRKYEPGTILVVDSAADNDLKCACAYLEKNGNLRALAGCAGAAKQLARVLGLPKQSSRPEENRMESALWICGSVHPTSLSQVEYAVSQGVFHPYPVSSHQLLGLDALDAQAVATLLAEKHRVVLSPEPSSYDAQQMHLLAGANNICANDVPAMIAQSYGNFTTSIVRLRRPDTIIIFGGDTTSSILRCLNCDRVYPQGEVYPGVVLSRVDNACFSGSIVSKAGGFGPKDLLKRMGFML